MVKQKKETEPRELIRPQDEIVDILPDKRFTGVAHAMVYKPHEGFANYAVATIVMIDGEIESVAYGIPRNKLDLFAEVDDKNNKLFEEMRKHYPTPEKYKW